MGKVCLLGNLTSQFFANVYLNELDQYVKHILNAKFYIKYVDDGAYDYEELHKLTRENNNGFFASLRKNSMKMPKGFFRKKCVQKQVQYSMRIKNY